MTPNGRLPDADRAVLGGGLGTLPAMEVLVIGTADAIVFAAGAGSGSGPARKRTVDYGAAVQSMGAASDLGVTGFVIVSSIDAHDVAGAAEAMRPYPQAKRDADDALKQASIGCLRAMKKPPSLLNAGYRLDQ